ncbi:hypothetical protein ACTFIW_010324 [Dictyostelium discoideum]
MPFGLSTDPRIFTMLLRHVLQILKDISVPVIAYLDDLIIVGSTKEECLSYLKKTIDLLVKLVLFSYSWGEILSLPFLHQAFHTAKQLLVIVELGTPKEFAAILKARKVLLKQQAFIVAPCHHAHKCPLTEGTSWCHFGLRLERSWEHQWMKEAYLGAPSAAALYRRRDTDLGDYKEGKSSFKKAGKLKWGDALDPFDAQNC